MGRVRFRSSVRSNFYVHALNYSHWADLANREESKGDAGQRRVDPFSKGSGPIDSPKRFEKQG